MSTQPPSPEAETKPPMRFEGVEYRPLDYIERLDLRPLEAIEKVVMHATELPDLTTAVGPRPPFVSVMKPIP